MRRRWILAGALGACVLGLAACQPDAGSGTAGNGTGEAGNGGANTTANGPGTVSGAGKLLGCTIPTLKHPFFVAMDKGLREEAQAAGAEINVVDGEDKAQTQLTAIDSFVTQRADAIVLCPTESKNLPPGVAKANAAKIPVITVNRTVDGGGAVTYVGADDTDGGRLQGKAVLEALPKGGKIVLLQGVLGSSPQLSREAGLEEALKGRSEYEIVDRIPTNFQRKQGVDAMETALVKYPKGAIDAVVAQSDDGALAAAEVCQRRGRTEIKIIGFNGESAAFDEIRAGRIYATVLQDAETQGREAVRAALRHLNGEKLPEKQITPLYLVTKANIDQHKPAWQSATGE